MASKFNKIISLKKNVTFLKYLVYRPLMTQYTMPVNGKSIR